MLLVQTSVSCMNKKDNSLAFLEPSIKFNTHLRNFRIIFKIEF